MVQTSVVDAYPKSDVDCVVRIEKCPLPPSTHSTGALGTLVKIGYRGAVPTYSMLLHCSWPRESCDGAPREVQTRIAPREMATAPTGQLHHILVSPVTRPVFSSITLPKFCSNSHTVTVIPRNQVFISLSILLPRPPDLSKHGE